MTRPAKMADLTQIRDNQRRSRARREEYVQELEQRLRLYELQGIEAPAEVQKSARGALDENKQLRELLNRCGVSDGCILHYLQPSAVSNREPSPEEMMRAGDREVATEVLQQPMLPKQATSSIWEPSRSAIAYSHHPQYLGVCPPHCHHYSPSVFPMQPATTQSTPFQSSSRDT